MKQAPSSIRKKMGACACCERQTRLEFHHLIPRKNHRKPRFRRLFTLDDMRHRGIDVCRDCHRAIHRFFDERYLGLELNTLEALMATEQMQTFVAWVSKRRLRC